MSLGKPKRKVLLLSVLSPTTAGAATAPNSTRPPLAVTFPASKLTLPPTSPNVRPGLTCRPTPPERLVIFPALVPNCKPKGTLTVSSGAPEPGVALNWVPSAKLILLAVVPINDPPISNLAF